VADRLAAIREAAEADLTTFIKLINPRQVMGSVHERVCRWWARDGAKNHQLLLMPRDHQKSRLIAYRCAHRITIQPDVRILYLSSTSGLAEKQLKFIKDILTSPIYRRYWPEHVHIEEGKRERWTTTEIAVDHPARKYELIRDPTVFIGGLTTNFVGMHCDVAVLDDCVVNETAYTRDGRDKLKTQYSLLSSIEGGEAEEWIVGTRYDPRDLYNDLKEMKEPIFSTDGTGTILREESVYEILEFQVEDLGDGTGEFLWPRQQRADGKWFGFDMQILARKKAKYLDKAQFRSQYYNDPNDPDSAPIRRTEFQYYDRNLLKRSNGKWSYCGRPLNIAAAIDFAYARTKRADYTAIVVGAMDADRNYFVLDIERFKTEDISEYFRYIKEMHMAWGFTKLRAEITAAQQTIVTSLRKDYIAREGLVISVDEFRPNRGMGTKEERIDATLGPRYENKQMWHYEGGNCQILEDELVSQRPPHDDVKNAWADVVDLMVPPTARRVNPRVGKPAITNSRFGGVAF
jgi:hypothetical protein